MRLILSLVGAALLTGCAAPVTEAEAPPRVARCDATGARSLVGSHVGAVDFASGSNVRIVCTTCAATDDHDPDRLNLRFDEKSGIIQSVDCG